GLRVGASAEQPQGTRAAADEEGGIGSRGGDAGRSRRRRGDDSGARLGRGDDEVQPPEAYRARSVGATVERNLLCRPGRKTGCGCKKVERKRGHQGRAL